MGLHPKSSSASRGSSLRYRWIVIKVNDLAVQEELGLYRKVLKWAVAYKFPAEEEEAKILSVDWTVGRTGV